jgi:hypothetical protein
VSLVTEDGWLIGTVAAVWAALAALYAFVPMFDMPGSALVWGSGAVIFFVLAALTARAERRSRG